MPVPLLLSSFISLGCLIIQIAAMMSVVSRMFTSGRTAAD